MDIKRGGVDAGWSGKGKRRYPCWRSVLGVGCLLRGVPKNRMIVGFWREEGCNKTESPICMAHDQSIMKVFMLWIFLDF